MAVNLPALRWGGSERSFLPVQALVIKSFWSILILPIMRPGSHSEGYAVAKRVATECFYCLGSTSRFIKFQNILPTEHDAVLVVDFLTGPFLIPDPRLCHHPPFRGDFVTLVKIQTSK